MILPKDFYQRDVHTLARDLLGRDLIRRTPDGPIVGRIVEVEVYGGCHDPASHADTGEPTSRTRAMFGDPGTAYVYQIYGMYYCLNVVAPAEEKAAAILIRALEPLAGLDRMARGRGLRDKYDDEMPRRVEKNLLSGPGKLCQAFDVDLSFNGKPLRDGELVLASGEPIEDDDRVACTPRIGLNPKTVGDEACEWPWRLVVEDSDFLSR